MDLTITPDTYTPIIDEQGNYIDKVPLIRHGIYCPCGSRKDKAYDSASKFNTHVKSKVHQKWLAVLNQNRANHYVEMLQCRETVENQKKIISQLETQLQKKNLTIDYLTEQLTHRTPANNISVDLLNLN